jgi:hypothetical protein
MLDKIKKIKDRIYEFDLKNSEILDGEEIIVRNNVSEFVMTFRKRDLDKGIIVTPSGYNGKGLVYKTTNDGEFYNHPEWIPDIVNFAFNIYGLKKGSFYKITVVSRDTGTNTIITGDRRVIVTNEEKELLVDVNVKGQYENREYYGLFRTSDNETNLMFSIGKVYISNIIIEEVELVAEEVTKEDESFSEYGEGKIQLAAYAVFTTESSISDKQGRYLPMNRITGKGINLYLDKNTNEYVLERDNADDTLSESFTNANYIVDFNFNKVINKGNFHHYNITDVNIDLSPNTLKQGYIRFEFVDKDGKNVKFANKNNRLAVLIHKIH